MARIFTEDFYDLPTVDVLDWELWERLDKLIEPHVPPGYGLPLYNAVDRRGQYDALDLAALRAEVEQQEESPVTIRLSLSTSYQGNYSVNVYASTVIGSGGRVVSSDEAFVHHMAVRIRELFALAATAPTPETPAVSEGVTQGAMWQDPRAKLRRFFYDPWVISIGAALIVAGIIALIVALAH